MLLAIDFSWCPLERGIRAPRCCHLQTWLGKDKSVRCSRQTSLPGGPSGREWGFLYLAVLIMLIMLPQHGCNIFSGSEQVAHALTCVRWATGWYITILTCTRCTDFQRKRERKTQKELDIAEVLNSIHRVSAKLLCPDSNGLQEHPILQGLCYNPYIYSSTLWVAVNSLIHG